MTAVPGILQAFSLTRRGRKTLMDECAKLARSWLRGRGSHGVASLERLLVIHDMCRNEMVAGERLPKGFEEDISTLRAQVRARYPTLWERLGVI